MKTPNKVKPVANPPRSTPPQVEQAAAVQALAAAMP